MKQKSEKYILYFRLNYEFDCEMKPLHVGRSIAQDPSLAIYSSLKESSRTPPKKSNGIYDTMRKESLSSAHGLYMVAPINDYQVAQGICTGEDLDHIYVSTEDMIHKEEENTTIGRNDNETCNYNAIYSTHNTFTKEL